MLQTVSSPLTPTQVANALLHTHWVFTYEVGLLNMLEWFSYKTAERVVHYDVKQEDEHIFHFTPRKESWNQKAADTGWRVPTITLSAEPAKPGSKVTVSYTYRSYAHLFVGCWIAGWLLFITLALTTGDRDNGFGIGTVLVLGTIGIMLGIATLADVQRNWQRIETTMNLLLNDSLTAPHSV